MTCWCISITTTPKFISRQTEMIYLRQRASQQAWPSTVAAISSRRILTICPTTSTGTAPDGSRSTFASGLNYPNGLAFDGGGNLFKATIRPRMFKFTPGGIRSTFASVSGAVGLAFTNPVPEPSILVLLSIGTITLLHYAWRRRRGRQFVSATAVLLVLIASVAQADAFNMGGGASQSNDGNVDGARASLEFVTVGDPGNAANTATGSLTARSVTPMRWASTT